MSYFPSVSVPFLDAERGPPRTVGSSTTPLRQFPSFFKSLCRADFRVGLLLDLSLFFRAVSRRSMLVLTDWASRTRLSPSYEHPEVNPFLSQPSLVCPSCFDFLTFSHWRLSGIDHGQLTFRVWSKDQRPPSPPLMPCCVPRARVFRLGVMIFPPLFVCFGDRDLAWLLPPFLFKRLGLPSCKISRQLSPSSLNPQNFLLRCLALLFPTLLPQPSS